MNIEHIRISLIIMQIALAILHDIREYRIKNYIPLCFISFGFLYQLSWGGPAALCAGLLGLVIPFLLLFPLYVLKMLGAGDIKLLCSLGLLLGPGDILLSILYSFLSGGFLALLLMACRKNLHIRLRQVLSYFTSCVLTMSMMPYEEVDRRHQARMHFSIPIALGVLAVNYLKL